MRYYWGGAKFADAVRSVGLAEDGAGAECAARVSGSSAVGERVAEQILHLASAAGALLPHRQHLTSRSDSVSRARVAVVPSVEGVTAAIDVRLRPSTASKFGFLGRS